jgi:hypothetical protein
MVLFVMDHFSRSDNRSLGCRGHDCNLEKTRACSKSLKRQLLEAFKNDARVIVLHLSVETDGDALVFHSDNGTELDLGMLEGISRAEVKNHLQRVLADSERRISEPALSSILALATRNLVHVDRVRKAPRSRHELGHRGWVLNVGQGARDWLGKHQKALEIGPFDPAFPAKVRIAGAILAANARRPDFNRNLGVVLLSSAPFRPMDSESRRRAEHKALKLADQAMAALEDVDGLREHLDSLAVIVDMETRRAHVLS